MTRDRIAFAVGGSAGHVCPALAAAEACRARGVDVAFIGSRDGFAPSLIRGAGCRLNVVPGAAFYGERLSGKARAVAALLAGRRAARDVLRTEGVRLVLGTGGFACAGAVLGARSLGIKTALLEANARPGLVNRLLAPLVDRIFVTSDAARRAFRTDRALATGLPVRAQIAALASVPRNPPGLSPRLLVVGGSQGSPFLNERIPALAAALACSGIDLQVSHQSGAGAEARVEAAYHRSGVRAEVRAFIADMAGEYAQAHFAIACAGAGTIAELRLAGVPALLVPLAAAARDHQRDNAAAAAAEAGTWWVTERGWDQAETASRLGALLSDPASWTDASRRSRAAARPDAADALAEACLAMLD